MSDTRRATSATPEACLRGLRIQVAPAKMVFSLTLLVERKHTCKLDLSQLV